jgi:hypothetical protein
MGYGTQSYIRVKGVGGCWKIINVKGFTTDMLFGTLMPDR